MLTGVTSVDFRYRQLRAAWIGWLTTLLWLFANPAMVMRLPGIAGVYVLRSNPDLTCIRPDCAPESWMITEWSPWTGRETLCTALALAWVVPTAFHIYRRRRFGSVLRFERLGWMDGEPAGYRAPPPYRALLDAQALGAHFGAYTWRLLAATALGATVFFELWGPSFVKRHDCTPRPMFSVPEYLTYCALLLLVMLLHMPTPRRVFGVSTARLRRAAQ